MRPTKKSCSIKICMEIRKTKSRGRREHKGEGTKRGTRKHRNRWGDLKQGDGSDLGFCDRNTVENTALHPVVLLLR